MKNMKYLMELEKNANIWLAGAKHPPVGPDRRPYVSVAYSAAGKFECITSQGCREYLAPKVIAEWMR